MSVVDAFLLTGLLFSLVCIFCAIAASLDGPRYAYVSAIVALPVAVLSFLLAIWLNIG